MKTIRITLRTTTDTYTVEARIEDDRTLSVSRTAYLAVKGTTASEVYAVAIIGREGHRYNFGGIVGDRAYFTR